MAFATLVDAIPSAAGLLPLLPGRGEHMYARTGFRKLRLYFERRVDTHYAQLRLSCSLISQRL